jgi:DNA polymerase III epsilon subunit-like protein
MAESAMEQRLIFVDLETGGPDPKRHPIIQIAAIAVDGESLASLEAIELKLRVDERRATKYALRKNLYSRKLWQEKAWPEEEAARRFADFLKRHATHSEISRNGSEYYLAHLVAHNAEFDVAFLNSWYDRLKMYFPARRQALCTLQRCLWYFFENPSGAPPNFRLDTLCRHFGVTFAAADAHDALGDVRATVALYKALVARAAAAPYSTAA